MAATIFATALGSSSVAELAYVGRPLRWLFLLSLLAIAALWAAARREGGRLPPAFVGGVVFFVALTIGSTLWSVKPLLSLERALTLAALIAAVGLAADAVRGRPDRAEGLLLGVLAGAAAVALAGLVVLAVDRSVAIRAASLGVPARYQGLGESPNTAALLLALAVPLAIWLALVRRRAVGTALLALFVGSMAASGSRGALVGAFVGTVVVIVLTVRRARSAIVLVCVSAAVFAGAVGVGELSSPGKTVPAAATAPTAGASGTRGRYVNVESVFPLEDDIGRPLPGRGEAVGGRSLIGSSGRLGVWGHALEQALARPIAGYGFGTEDKVFVDRYANFEGHYVESSYVGLLLQLGVIGLGSFFLILALAAWNGLRTPRDGGFAAAATGTLAAGLVVAGVQSYVYSAGNTASMTFWLAATLTAAAAPGAVSR